MQQLFARDALCILASGERQVRDTFDFCKSHRLALQSIFLARP